MLVLIKTELLRVSVILISLLILVVCFRASGAVAFQTRQAPSQPGTIKEGIGVGEILIGTSTAADVEARHGTNFKLLNRKDYSYRMDYAEQGLAFYYCYKDDKKRIFLIELHHGVTGKGIVIGQSTLKDVGDLYGERSGGGDSIFEYKGIQFYVEGDPKTDQKDKAPGLERKVVEIDIVPPDKSSNFCDEYLPRK
jgi:hypothetical protein